MNYPLVISVSEKSLAEKAGIKTGDKIVSVNGEAVKDLLDYRFFTADLKLNIKILNSDGTERELYIDNFDGLDLGLELCYGEEGKTKRCKNKCIFCFIDQMPGGMRDSLYVKDDDVRLSFLTGSYITLTNLTERDIERIIYQRISPVNVSVHTVNPKLRVKMLKNKHAGDVYKIMKRLARHKITMNCQVVLVKDINDKKELTKTIKKLFRLYPYVGSLSVVPVGLTKFRENLPKLEPFTKEDSENVIDLIESFQKKARKKRGVSFVYASDEFYLNAKRPLPEEESYDGYPQIENGVGMITSFREEAKTALSEVLEYTRDRSVGIITGFAAKDVMEETAKEIMSKFNSVKCSIYPIKNNFFGGGVTVAGLVCGKDVKEQLKGKKLPDELLMPDVMFRAETDIMLDDVTIGELEKELNVKITKIKTDGFSTVGAILGIEI